jgi:hypothetical protein
MWRETAGYKIAEFSGVSGSVAVPKGAIILLMIAHASAGGATLTTLNNNTVPVVNGANPLYIQNYHALMQQNSGTNAALVFTGTDMYYVQMLVPGNI